MSTGLLEQRANYTATNYEYGYGSGGGADADNDGRKEIDCSQATQHGALYPRQRWFLGQQRDAAEPTMDGDRQ